MTEHDKQSMLDEAKQQLAAMTGLIEAKLDDYAQSLEAEAAAYQRIKGETAYEDRLRAYAVGANTTLLRDQMLALKGSPYFARCDLAIGDDTARPIYFGKYGSSELGVYSWASPLAAVRFEAPGNVSYETPDGQAVTGLLERRDQFLIARDKIRFMASESLGWPRELIYQEHFSQRKAGFVLPEIVAQMEQAQDRVIRAPHRGSFAISGPAGSGKTTLALHRIAFLCASPETADLYPAEDILVLVQDYKTRDYFSHLLPELGINDVDVMTFGQWALRTLALRRYFYRDRPGADQSQNDRYESAKLQAVSITPASELTEASLKRYLQGLYEPFMEPDLFKLLKSELADGALDRHDLTHLLQAAGSREGGLSRSVESHTFLPGGRIRTKVTREPLRYALVLVDEFQNYMPSQLRILKNSVSGRNEAILYVGDLGQQTRFGALQSWDQFGESLPVDRQIRLQKVYRNTAEIMRFIGEVGYDVSIPDGAASGPEVEIISGSPAAGIARAREIAPGPGSTMGIVAMNDSDLDAYREALGGASGIITMTVSEAQGVEFDTVMFVGLKIPVASSANESGAVYVTERRRIDRDLQYVALTRAVSRLVVVGEGDVATTLRTYASVGESGSRM